AWGFDAPGISQGMALGDLDGDGDLDVVVNNLNQEAWLYRNDSPAPRLSVRLRGVAPNTQGIGARLILEGVPGVALPPQSQSMVAGGRYLGGDQTMRSFAVGGATHLALEVRWPGGKVSRIPHARPGTLLEIPEPADPGDAVTPSAGTGNTWFADASESVGHSHRGVAGGRRPRQPLLPYALDADGPGVSWFDMDGDGWDDLMIGAGAGDRVAVYRNRSGEGFERWTSPRPESPLQRDAVTVLGWEPGPDGAPTLLAALSRGEEGLEHGPGVQALDFQSGTVRDIAPVRDASIGPLLMADVDGDGDLDLFEGGRVQTGRWPEPASSVLHRNEAGTFRPDAANRQSLDRMGLVRGGVFSDLDSDGDPDLVLTCEWGAPRILRNEGGRLEPWDLPLSWPSSAAASPASRCGTLSALTGLWTSVTAGDFDGDGRPDLVLGNWGRNAREHAFPGVQLWHGDFSGQGGVEFIEALVDSRTARVVPWRARDALAPVMPWLVENRPTARAFAEASLEELLAGRPAPAGRLPLATTESLILLNRGASFLASLLPLEAQVAPAFGLAVADFNGDGREDLFVAQNFFQVEPETSRLDAGRGLVLEGDGRGGFQPVSGQASGIQLSGEQRGAAVADINHDGRPDLAVGQHSGPTRIFLNRVARPGLRLRLRGLPGNPAAVGASVRLESAGVLGPAREIRAGGGHRSQDSPVLVLASAEPPTAVVVRWPGGTVRRIPVPPGARFLELRQDAAGP
ncbi:MAG: VCBS repeat-containing protein, partial [Verrucomicrobia bacterium]|nr:VCBS repeat-containing protein [Verrucomicrobiota bacterium]